MRVRLSHSEPKRARVSQSELGSQVRKNIILFVAKKSSTCWELKKLKEVFQKTCFAHSFIFILCIYSSKGDYEHGFDMAVGGRSRLRMSILNQF